MSALREAMSHAVLGWVKPELDETLRQVRQEIEYSDKARKRVRVYRLFELFTPVSKLVIDQCLAFAKGVAGEAGVKPGGDLLSPKISTFLSGHSENPAKR